MVILENIDIDTDIDKAILQNIDIDKISNRFKFGISNRAMGESAKKSDLFHFEDNTRLVKILKIGGEEVS